MYEPRPTPFASSHFSDAPYALTPITDFGFLFAPGGGGAGSGSGLISGPAPPARPRQEPDPKPEPAVGVGVAAAAIAGRRYASKPVSVISSSSSSSSPSSSTSSPSSSVAAAAAGIAVTNLLRLPRRRSQFPPSQQPSFDFDMASQQQQPQHDVAAQQEAAEEYQPDLKARPPMLRSRSARILPPFPEASLLTWYFAQGPFVGEKTSSDAITHEYARADQVYVEKTIVRPPFPHFLAHGPSRHDPQFMSRNSCPPDDQSLTLATRRLYLRHTPTTVQSRATETVAGEVSAFFAALLSISPLMLSCAPNFSPLALHAPHTHAHIKAMQ